MIQEIPTFKPDQDRITEIIRSSPMPSVYFFVGPIAAGKSHISGLLESEFGIPVFKYEHLFVEEQRMGGDDWRQRAEARAQTEILSFIQTHDSMCIENTMERPYAMNILSALRQVADVRVIRVNTPLELTQERILKRNQEIHVHWSDEQVSRIHDISTNKNLKVDLTIQNNKDFSREEILTQLRELVEQRTWHEDYVEVNHHGHQMRFAWNKNNLTPYDREYQPWGAMFRENNGYLLHASLKPGDVIVDAGGYTGTFAIFAAKAVGPSGSVIVYEPDPQNCTRLHENVRLNGLNNVVVRQAALWERDTELKFHDTGTAGAGAFRTDGSATHQVEAVSLDNDLTRLGIHKLTFLKADVEGAEEQLVTGAKRILQSSNVNVAIATYHIINGQPTSDAVELSLKQCGYHTHTEYPPHLTTYGIKLSQ